MVMIGSKGRRLTLRWRMVLGVTLFVAACAPAQPAPVEPTVPPTIPTPTPKPVSPEDVAAEYLRQWQDGQYGRMYEMLSVGARATTPRDLFVRRHTNIRS